MTKKEIQKKEYVFLNGRHALGDCEDCAFYRNGSGVLEECERCIRPTTPGELYSMVQHYINKEKKND